MGCITLEGTVYFTICSVASSCPSVMTTFNSLLVSGNVLGADTYLAKCRNSAKIIRNRIKEWF